MVNFTYETMMGSSNKRCFFREPAGGASW